MMLHTFDPKQVSLMSIRLDDTLRTIVDEPKIAKTKENSQPFTKFIGVYSDRWKDSIQDN